VKRVLDLAAVAISALSLAFSRCRLTRRADSHARIRVEYFKVDPAECVRARVHGKRQVLPLFRSIERARRDDGGKEQDNREEMAGCVSGHCRAVLLAPATAGPPRNRLRMNFFYVIRTHL